MSRPKLNTKNMASDWYLFWGNAISTHDKTLSKRIHSLCSCFSFFKRSALWHQNNLLLYFDGVQLLLYAVIGRNVLSTPVPSTPAVFPQNRLFLFNILSMFHTLDFINEKKMPATLITLIKGIKLIPTFHSEYLIRNKYFKRINLGH